MTQKPLKMGISSIFRQFSFIFVHFQMNQSCVDVLTKSAKSICKFLHLYFKLFNNQHTAIPIVNLSVLHKKRATISDYSCSSGNWTRTSDLYFLSQSINIISGYKIPNQFRGVLTLVSVAKPNMISSYKFIMLNRD